MLQTIKCLCKPLHSLIKPLLNLAANHHTHHHIELSVEHHSYTGISRGNLMELNPESEVDRHATVITSDLTCLPSTLSIMRSFTVKPLTLNEQLSSVACHSSTLSATAGVSSEKLEIKGKICDADLNIWHCFDSYFSIVSLFGSKDTNKKWKVCFTFVNFSQRHTSPSAVRQRHRSP